MLKKFYYPKNGSNSPNLNISAFLMVQGISLQVPTICLYLYAHSNDRDSDRPASSLETNAQKISVPLVQYFNSPCWELSNSTNINGMVSEFIHKHLVIRVKTLYYGIACE